MDEEITRRLEAMEERVAQAEQRADAAEAKVAGLERRPAPPTPAEIPQEEISKQAKAVAEEEYKRTGSREAAQLAYIRKAEELAAGGDAA